MTKDSDPVTVTLPRARWRVVERVLHEHAKTDRQADVSPGGDLIQSLVGIRHALNPASAPDPATFQVVEPDPKRTKPWPELKSSQDADDASSHG